MFICLRFQDCVISQKIPYGDMFEYDTHVIEDVTNLNLI